MKTQTFTVTEQHLKLMRRFQVGWQHCQTGAPEIDPKRPYGRSSVLEDIHEILTGESIGCPESKHENLTDSEIDQYEKLHRETETALQIALATGQFKAGKYECDLYSTAWSECSGVIF